MAGGKKKRLPAAKAGSSQRTKKVPKASKATKEDRRAHKLARRKEKKVITPAQWNEPAPAHLVAKLDIPRIKSKYQSYFEFAENSEKQEKKLEFQVTDRATPSPGFVFVPIGDPKLTQKCKELSREQDAMIFIVSNKGREEGSKISEHIYRTGYHFRETIVDAARDIIGETIISKPMTAPGFIEPIPETQEEINEQADGAIRDLFPRIPNTDRQMIIEHAFKKGGMFHGEPTVGLQSEIPLSRRVQLAVLAHIRHTHTRYDKLLRETTWINARKVVEPVCLDVLIKWRGDEETGRDQLDEILREVVVITDSEGEDDEDESSEDETSDEEGEVSSASSTEPPSNPASRNQQRPVVQTKDSSQLNRIAPDLADHGGITAAVSGRTRAKTNPNSENDKKKQRGFSRYQAAWQDAVHRQQGRLPVSTPGFNNGNSTHNTTGPSTAAAVSHNASAFANSQSMNYPPSPINHGQYDQARYVAAPISATRAETHYSHPRSPLRPPMHGNEVNMRSQPERPFYHSYTQPRESTPSYVVRERPPQVVRGSPVRHSPQDLPLPSIETSSNFASPRADVHSDMLSFNHPRDPYPRRVVEQRVESPLQRQVIVIDDDSPQVKRRRIVREDDVGHFRYDPVSSSGHDFYVAAPSRPDSHFISTSSAEAGNFLPRHPQVSSQATQGLLRHRQPVFIDPVTSEELPVFDEPDRGHFARRPIVARPSNGDYAPDNRSGYSMQQAPPLYLNDVRRADLQPVYTQHDRTLPVEPERVGGYRNVPEPLQYHDVRQNSVRADRDLVHSFSQSRLDASASHTNNEFIVLSERGRPQNNVIRDNRVPYYDDAGPRLVQHNASSRARSPVRYTERPVERVERSYVTTAHHDNYNAQRVLHRNDPGSQYQHQLPSGQATYVRSTDPRRQVVVLE